MHVRDELREDEELGLEVDLGVGEEEVEQRLVLLHEDAEAMEEGDQNGTEVGLLLTHSLAES